MIVRRAIVLRAFAVGVVVALASCVFVALTVQTASAHAVLELTEPAADSINVAAPTSVEMRFSEPVELVGTPLRVVGTQGTVSIGEATHDRDGHADGVAVRAEIRDVLSPGWYVVSWRVLSTDSHVIQGSFRFGVGTAQELSQLPNSTAPASPDSNAPSHTVEASVATFLAYGALVASVGVLFASALGGFAIRELVGVRRLAMLGSAVAMFALATLVVVQMLRIYGTLWSSLSFANVQHVFATRSVQAWAIRTIGTLVAFVLLGSARFARVSRTWHVVAGLALTIVVGLGAAYGGHGASGRWAGFGVAFTVMHVGAIIVWLAGLSCIVIGRTRVPTTSIQRFSTVALACVGLVIASGALQVLRQVETWSNLWSSRYGQLVLAKIALFAFALVIAAAVRRGLTKPDVDERALMRQRLRIETFLVVVVLGLSSVLVQQTPHASAGSAGAASTAIDLVDFAESSTQYESFAMEATVDPGSKGLNTVTLSIRSRAQNDVLPDEITARFENAAVGVYSLPLRVAKVDDQTYISQNVFIPQEGLWSLHVSARFGTFDVLNGTAKLFVASS